MNIIRNLLTIAGIFCILTAGRLHEYIKAADGWPSFGGWMIAIFLTVAGVIAIKKGA